jgi:signal peptide peptidase-like protein 2B
MRLVIAVLLIQLARGKTPDAELYLSNKDKEEVLLASYGNFGSLEKFSNLSIQQAPADDALLCGNSTVTSAYVSATVLLVPRGECSFQYKQLRAMRDYGTAGVVIYNTLESRYGWNETSNDNTSGVIYPLPQNDYECALGSTVLKNPPFALDPPAYDGSIHDPYLIGDSPDNLCDLPDSCDSQRCLLIDKREHSPTDTQFEACCAWDIHVSMTEDSDIDNTLTNDGVAVFVTMQQGDALRQQPFSIVTIQARLYPRWNVSSFLLWILATLVVYIASWYSAQDYRRAHFQLMHPQRDETPPSNIEMTHRNAQEQVAHEEEPTSQEETTHEIPQEVPQERLQEELDNVTEHAGTSRGHPAPQEAAPPQEPSQEHPPEPPQPQPRRPRRVTSAGSLELTVWHAASFVVIASALLLLLFFFEFYTAVTVLYALGCAGAVTTLITKPLYQWGWVRISDSGVLCERPLCPKVTTCSLGSISLLDLTAIVTSYTIASLWLAIWFVADNPSQVTIYWILQNVFGACICILFLRLLKLNSIKVATVLLLAVFFYDIFFVFLTPYLFDGNSVMVTVATGGGPADVSVDYCEKYPSDNQCRQGQPLPMLLALPKINDFRGGSVLLGLGDIVLPGLLTSFAARVDAAKRLVTHHTTLHVLQWPKGGYLPYLIFAYAVGLLLANIAVVLMQRGQPALLYLVPATLE